MKFQRTFEFEIPDDLAQTYNKEDLTILFKAWTIADLKKMLKLTNITNTVKEEENNGK